MNNRGGCTLSGGRGPVVGGGWVVLWLVVVLGVNSSF